MALFTASAPQEKHFVVRRPTGYGLPFGKHVRCIGTVPAWLTAQADETDEPYPLNPDDTFIADASRDAADARMVNESMAAAVRHSAWLDSVALQLKIPG